VDYESFLIEVIDGGMEAAGKDYAGDSPSRTRKREGAIKGFEECRGKTPEELAALLTSSNARTQEAYREQDDDYWYWRCRALEIEWVCNVVSAMLQNEGRRPLAAHLPTARGVMRAAEIVGVAAA